MLLLVQVKSFAGLIRLLLLDGELLLHYPGAGGGFADSSGQFGVF